MLYAREATLNLLIKTPLWYFQKMYLNRANCLISETERMKMDVTVTVETNFSPGCSTLFILNYPGHCLCGENID